MACDLVDYKGFIGYLIDEVFYFLSNGYLTAEYHDKSQERILEVGQNLHLLIFRGQVHVVHSDKRQLIINPLRGIHNANLPRIIIGHDENINRIIANDQFIYCDFYTYTLIYSYTSGIIDVFKKIPYDKNNPYRITQLLACNNCHVVTSSAGTIALWDIYLTCVKLYKIERRIICARFQNGGLLVNQVHQINFSDLVEI
jgi:hypothetical protein